MGFRFWRRVKIAPGVTLNLSKSGGSISVGPRGAKVTVGPGGVRGTVGIPGTGLFYTTASPRGKRGRRSGASQPAPAPADRLTMGFFERLLASADEKALVDGCRELATGREDEALVHLQGAVHLADGAYLAGFLALKQGRMAEAGEYLSIAAAKADELGRYFGKFGLAAVMSLDVTEEVAARVGPDLRGALLGLTEVYQRQGNIRDALQCLKRLRELESEDPVVKLSMIELIWESGQTDHASCREISGLVEGVANETPVHAALLLYKARALRGLGLSKAAQEVLTEALRLTKDRSDELLRALRYERALVYEELGQAKRARSEFEKIYAQDAGYEDVAKRLGL